MHAPVSYTHLDVYKRQLLGREEPNVSVSQVDAFFSVKEYQQTQCSPQTQLVCLYTEEFTANICWYCITLKMSSADDAEMFVSSNKTPRPNSPFQ